MTAPDFGAPFLEPRHLTIRSQALKMKTLEPLDEEAEEDVHAAARAAVQRLGRAGLLRHAVPKAWGGASPEVEVRSLVAAREGVAYRSGLADAMLALQGLGSLIISLHGSDSQRRTWLPRIATGRAIPAFALTEPEAGSDVLSMTTRAKPTSRGFQLDGVKTFISNAGVADYYCVFAKTDAAAGSKGVSAFLVPANARGLKVEPLHPIAAHPLGTVRLRNVRVGKDALIGEAGTGYKGALASLDRMRPTVAAAACGMALRALDEAVKRSRSRRQFGHPLSENQGLRWKLAAAATELDAARLLVYRAAYLKDQGQERISYEGAQAKLFATEAAQRAIDLAVQVHGGLGVMRGTMVERLYREIRALRIYEGTTEILHEIVGRTLLE